MKTKQIKDVFNIIGGKPAPKGDNVFTDYGIPFVKMKDLGKAHHTNNLIIFEQFVTEDVAARNKLNLVRKGAILLPRSGSVALNHRAILGVDAYIVSHICALEVKSPEEIDNTYAYYYMCSINMDRITKKTTGLDAITFEDLGKLKIPLPPLSDQKRIAFLLSKVEGMITRRRENLAQLDELLKSVFLEMFGDPVRNEKGWEKKKICDFALVKIGPFGSLLHADDYVNGGIPLINPSHIINGEIIAAEDFSVSEEKFQELSSYHLKQNDVIIARRGEIGRCAVVKSKAELLCGTGSMFVRITGNFVPTFLQFLIYSTSLKCLLESKAKGVTMKNLNSSIVEMLEVLSPPSDMQKRFASIVAKVETLKSKYQQNLSDLEHLYSLLCQKVFKGELDLSKVTIPGADLKKFGGELKECPFEEGLSETAYNVLADLNAINGKFVDLSTIVRAFRPISIESPGVQLAIKNIENISAKKISLEQLGQISDISKTLEKLSPQIPKVLPKWLENQQKRMRTITAPIEKLGKLFKQPPLLTADVSFSRQKMRFGNEAINIEGEIGIQKRGFTREDIIGILKKAGEPLCFEQLAEKLSDLEEIDLNAYEKIKEIIFELLSTAEIKQVNYEAIGKVYLQVTK